MVDKIGICILTFSKNDVIIVSNDTFLKGFVMCKAVEVSVLKKKLPELLPKLFLFSALSPDLISEISGSVNFEAFEFEAGENIFTPDDFSKKIGFVISGECVVEKSKPDGSSLPLNTLLVGDSFGILTLFSSSRQFPTVIKSKKRSKVLFISGEDVIALIRGYYQISLAIISFMSGRIEFLNKKIATFSADTVEEKLATHILNVYRASSEDHIVLNFSQTAKVLNAGRASIYRAAEALAEMSLIKLENKKIYITDLEGLERISQ